MKRSLWILFLLALASCKTYYITPDSFKAQITSTTPFNLKDQPVSYLATKIKQIQCTDKKGNEIFLENSPSVEMKVIKKDGKTAIFYFNTVIFQDNTLRGSKSIFLPGITATIPLDSIAKIEVQNGGKSGY